MDVQIATEIDDLFHEYVNNIGEYITTLSVNAIKVISGSLSDGDRNVDFVFGYHLYQKYSGTEAGRRTNWSASAGYLDFYVSWIKIYGIFGNVPVPCFIGGIYKCETRKRSNKQFIKKIFISNSHLYAIL